MSETMDLATVEDHGTGAALPATVAPWQREPTPMDLIRDALARGADLETVKELRALAVEMDRWQARKAFDRAMADAKAEIPPIIKNRTVDFVGKTGVRTHYKHEDLAEIARTVDPILAKHGLSYRFRTHNPPNEPVTVTCVISHRDGYFEENTLSGPRDDSGNKNSHQQVGSALTYLQRYALKAALGLAASNDDDGRKAGDAPSGTITDDQVEDLRSLIVEAAPDLPKFLENFGIDDLAELPVLRFSEAKAILNMKIKADQKKARAKEGAEA